ncbi:hypothetical protein EDD85DRAFT_946265 [Armillaria nabsnona]|nr:hypothetical protein EDD85DRAFT_946265 [Armillaria nabsnona]
MAPSTRSQLDVQDDGGRDTGTKKSKKPTVQSEDDAHTPTDNAGSNGKKKGHSKKKTLTFKVTPAPDSESIFEGRVQETTKDIDMANDKDGSYSINEMEGEYEHFTIPIPNNTGMGIDTNNGLGLSTNDLTNDGYIPLMGFQSNSAFSSLQNSPVTRREPLPSNSQWRRGDTQTNTEMPTQTQPTQDETGASTQAKSMVLPVMETETITHTNNCTTGQEEAIPSLSKPNKPVEISSDDDDDDESDYMSVRKKVKILLDNEQRVRTEVLSDLGGMTSAEMVVARAFAHSQTMKVFKWLGFSNIESDSEEFIVECNANLAAILIGRSFLHAESMGVASKPSVCSFTEQKAAIRKQLEKGKKKTTTKRFDEEIPIKSMPHPNNKPKHRPNETPKQ